MNKKVVKQFHDFNNYVKNTECPEITEFMYYLHPIYPYLSVGKKEEMVIAALEIFPQLKAYALLKNVSDKLELPEKFSKEYKETNLASFIDDCETNLIMGFGEVETFRTYAKLYCTEWKSLEPKIRDKVSRQMINFRLENLKWVD